MGDIGGEGRAEKRAGLVKVFFASTRWQTFGASAAVVVFFFGFVFGAFAFHSSKAGGGL